jgi:hypothetical protein
MDRDIDKPAHYTQGSIEVIDFIEDQKFGYCDGNAVKYISRYRHKGTPLQDLKKARWYIQRLIENLEKEAHDKESDNPAPGTIIRYKCNL